MAAARLYGATLNSNSTRYILATIYMPIWLLAMSDSGKDKPELGDDFGDDFGDFFGDEFEFHAGAAGARTVSSSPVPRSVAAHARKAAATARA